MKDFAKKIIDSKAFQNFIMLLIILNSITLGIETFPLSLTLQTVFNVFNRICLIIFIIEIALKIVVFGAKFFKDGWNIFDFLIVLLSLIPEVAFLSSARAFRIFRIFRVFRATRVITKVEKLKVLVEAMLAALPSIGWTVGILCLIFYIFAIIGTGLFATVSPDYFGNLWQSMYSLFQLSMADDIGNITWPIIRQDPYAFIYFVSFIAIAVMLILNTVVGIIVDSVEEARKQREKNLQQKTTLKEINKELKELQEQLSNISDKIDLVEKDIIQSNHEIINK